MFCLFKKQKTKKLFKTKKNEWEKCKSKNMQNVILCIVSFYEAENIGAHKYGETENENKKM